MRQFHSYAATIAAILLTSQAAFAGALFPTVVVTPAPLKPYVDEILKGHGEAVSLLRPGQSAHALALTPSQAQMLMKADIVIIADAGMSPVLAAMIAKNKHAQVIELSTLAGASPLPYPAENPWAKAAHNHDYAKGADAPTLDPHLWLSPARMAAIALPLAESMGHAAPEAAPTFVANADALATHLTRETIPALKAMLSRTPDTKTALEKPLIPFITYHAGYQYFLQEFGVRHEGEITQRPEEMLGAKTAASLIEQAQTLHIRCVIAEQKTPLIERIAEAADARVVILSPEQLPPPASVDLRDWIRNDYDRFLYTTAKTFAGCLRK